MRLSASSNRPTLRGALPWLQVGFALLALSILAWVAASVAFDHGGSMYGLGIGGRIVGWLGAGAVLLGLSKLARRSRVAFFAAVCWCGELALRFYGEEAHPVEAALTTAAPSVANAYVAQRVLLAALAMIAASIAIPRLFRGDDPRTLRASWNFTLCAFLVQLLAVGILVWHARGHDIAVSESWARWRAFVPWNLGLALAWLLFAAPFVHLVVSLRRTSKHNARRFVG